MLEDMNIIQNQINNMLMEKNKHAGVDMWECQQDPEHKQRFVWKKYIYNDGERNQWLTIETYANDLFTNLWIDKLWDGEIMGNGFIHKSFYSARDISLITFLIDLAD
jgi:hypothetical protein